MPVKKTAKKPVKKAAARKPAAKKPAKKRTPNPAFMKPVQPDELFDALERVWLQSPPPPLNDTESGAKVH